MFVDRHSIQNQAPQKRENQNIKTNRRMTCLSRLLLFSVTMLYGGWWRIMMILIVPPQVAVVAFSTTNHQHRITTTTSTKLSTARRDWLLAIVGSSAATAGLLLLPTTPALASGGATAGRYTTIPIAKRRYYGRVQQGVHEFLDMGSDIVKKDMNAPRIQQFFDPTATVVVEARRKDVNGQCTKKDGNCKGQEVRDSRYNDMKASMYLLANAFRTDQQKPPDRLPTVKAARAFFNVMDDLEKRVRVKKPNANDVQAVELYSIALNIMDRYLDLVELPPIDSGHYEKEFDVLVGETARLT